MTRPSSVFFARAMALVVAATGLTACEPSTDRSTDHALPSGHAASQLPSAPLLGADSVWRQDVSRAPLNASSPALVANLADQVEQRYGGVAAFNTGDYSVAFYEVGRAAPRADVVFDDCQGKGHVPEELTEASTNAPFVDVPVPAGAEPPPGTDGTISVWSPSTDQLWELWRAHKVGERWHACWGGRIDHVSRSDGRFPASTGVAASGLALAPGAVSLKEAASGRIDHALNLDLVDVAHFSSFSYPASRSDGSLPAGTPDAIPEGLRFRLDPALDVDSLHLSPVAAAIARAAQKYGFIVADKSGAVAISAERGPTGSESDRDGWDSVLGDTPSYQVLQDFPWSHLQALPMDYGKS